MSLSVHRLCVDAWRHDSGVACGSLGAGDFPRYVGCCKRTGVEDGGQMSEGGGRKTEGEGQKTEDGGRSTDSKHPPSGIRHLASDLWHQIRISGALTCLALILPLVFSWVLGHFTDFSWDGMTMRGITVRNLMRGEPTSTDTH